MNLKDQLQSDLKDAMRSGDVMLKNTLRMAISAIKLAEIEKNNPLDENAVLAVIQKEVKSRRESIADAERAGRPDLVQAAEQEINLLERYLPKAFDPAELETLARQAIQEAGATSLKEMGQVMKILMPQLQGRATGDQASQIVRRLLA
ncbi:MAG: GatB/YqeY domain-containing protein [Anaerolineales bacterium]|jgi:hypothetical protein|nr:GatB/YqeY domain-containing protein [Anaerolineales bacterium]